MCAGPLSLSTGDPPGGEMGDRLPGGDPEPGHVLGDLEVFTTAEVVGGEGLHLHFSRAVDHRTGFPELVVRPRPPIPEDRWT